MKADLRAAAIALHDRFTHEGMDRRLFMAEMTKLAGSAAAAGALVSAIAASPATAAIVPANDGRLDAEEIAWQGEGLSAMKGYLVRPRTAAGALPAVMVIHENRGLNEHIRDVARRAALAGYVALAPDFLSGTGGTPADEDAARDEIGRLDLARSAADGIATIRMLTSLPGTTGKVGVTGFCWGGGMTMRLAVAAGDALGAAVPFYGPAPDPSLAAQVQAPMLIQLAGLDARVNATAIPFAKALTAAGKDVTLKVHEGVNHAFHNDTSAERYDAAAAAEAWTLTTAFFDRHLKG